MNKKYHIFLENKRRAFQRGETVTLRFNIKGKNSRYLDDCRLEFEMGKWKTRIEIPELRFFHQFLEIELDTRLFRAGSYQLGCTLKQRQDVIAESVFDIFIAVPLSKERFVFWHWPATSYYNALETSEAVARHALDKLAALGFTHAQLRADWAIDNPEAAGKLIDYALTLGIELGGLVPNYNQGPFTMDGLPDEAAIVTDNKALKKIANPHHPLVVKRSRRWLEAMMNVLKDYPSCSTVFMNSELEDQLTLSVDPKSVKMHEHKLGFSLKKVKHLSRVFSESADEAEYIQTGVIADDDPEYLYSKYYYRYGDGWVSTNRLMADIVHEYRPDITVISDPFRLCSLYGRFDGVDAVASWTYTMPDPKMMLFNETLRCEALPDDKKIIQIITMYNYGGTLAPVASGRKSLSDVLCSGPDRYKESAWLNLSRAPYGMGIYFSSQLEPVIEDIDDYIRPQATMKAVKGFAEDILRPFGQVFRSLRTAPRRVAVLDSWASRVYGECPRPYNHYQNYFIYNFYILLNMAHIQADVIFEETINDQGLDGYEMLVLPCCDTLPEKVYRKICDFEKSGGKIVADQWLRADIPNAVKFDFDFSFRKNVNANAINKGMQFASNEDTAFKTDWKQQETTGISAETDRDIMEEYCGKLRETLDTFWEREVDCDTPRVLLNRLNYRQVKYLSLVNDNRTYDDRVGPYKAILGKGLEQKALITWKGLTGNEALYDLISGNKINYLRAGNKETQFEVTLPPAGGALIAAMPGEFRSLEISGVDKINNNGQESIFEASIPGAFGLIPLKVEITDPNGKESEFSGYYTMKDGKAQIPFYTALDDPCGKWRMTVVNLCDRSKVKTEFCLKEKDEN
jgi:hypothetical protein